MKALVTERISKGVTWCPFHFAGWFMGEDQRSSIRAAPIRSFWAKA